MYEPFWQLDQPPFENGVDPDFYYPSEGHQACLLKLRYTVEHRKGAAVLTGDRGVGKTLLIQMLRRQIDQRRAPFVHLVFPCMTPAEFLAYLAASLCGDATVKDGQSIDVSVRAVQAQLAANTAAGRHAVVVVDEAHLIDAPELWDALRLLLNFQSDGRCDLSLILVGQLPLLTALERMPAWEDRLAVRCLLRPLQSDETACYMQHRLRAAGRDDELFTPDAVSAVHQLTRGFPRRVNRVCDLALVVGYAEQLPSISRDEIEAVSSELTPASVE